MIAKVKKTTLITGDTNGVWVEYARRLAAAMPPLYSKGVTV